MDSSQATDVNLSTCSDATFEDSLRKLPNNGCCSIADSNLKISENSSRVLQVTDVNLSLVQILLKTSENSLWILPK